MCKGETICVGIIVIILTASILPIFILYGDGLEVTTAKRNTLLVTFLVPLGAMVIGCFCMCGMCKNGLLYAKRSLMS